MARPSKKDPLDKFRWTIKIDEFNGHMGFSSIETPSYSIITREYAEGGAHMHPRQIVDSISYRPITMSRGVTIDQNFYNWAKGPFEILEAAEGQIVTSSNAFGRQFTDSKGTGLIDSYRRTVIIEHLNRNGNVDKKYILYNAIPVEFEPASNFSSDADDALSMEKLVLKYEGFDVELGEPDKNLFGSKSIIKRIIRNT